jgi:hypothetical protein
MNMGSALWKSQPLASAPISLEEVRAQAEKLNVDYRAQLGAAYAGMAVCVGLFVLTFFPIPGYDVEVVRKAFRWALLAFGIGGFYLVDKIKRQASVLRASDQESIVQGVQAYRAELRRRRDYYLGAWRWSLLPAFSTLCILFVAGIVYDPGPAKVLRYSIAAATTAIGLVVGVWFQLQKGNEYQRELDTLSHARAGVDRE